MNTPHPADPQIAALHRAQAAHPRFAATSCSQCGCDTGPGNSGFSHCADHRARDAERAVFRAAAQAIDASQRPAFEAINQDATAAVAPRPRPIPHRQLDAWLVAEAARQPHQWLLSEARALARELAELKGDLSEAQTGACIVRLPLGDATVPVEYEYEAGEESQTYGPPENCYEGSPETLTILGVFIAGVWCDPTGVVPESVIEGWEQTLRDQMDDDRRADQDDAAEARAADREWA